MDGVIFKDINFWLELHKKFGTYEKGVELTKKYLHSNYNKLVEEVVGKLWKGKSATSYSELVNAIEYLPGVKTTFDFVHSRDLITAIISASSIDVARRVQKDYGIDHLYANELVIQNGKISGEFVWPIGAGKELKAKIIRDLCTDLKIKPSEVIYIGDSDTDIEAFKEVGFSIAFNSSSENLKKVASVVVEGEDLSKVITILKKRI
jgi:phosphoserine phosphatase